MNFRGIHRVKPVLELIKINRPLFREHMVPPDWHLDRAQPIKYQRTKHPDM